MRRLGFRRPINWVFNPAAAVVAGALGEESLIYHCVDEYTAFSGVASGSLAELERTPPGRGRPGDRLGRPALPVEGAVQPAGRSWSGTAWTTTTSARPSTPRRAVPEAIADLPRPVIGFFGLIADWVDVELMARVAAHFSGGSLVVLGKATTDVSALERLPNVHLLGREPYADLPAYCKGFDVALNPFRISELTLNANPLKVREYLAAGLPVVSTAIPEVEVLGQCRIGGGRRRVRRARSRRPWPTPGPRAARSEAIRPESWAARLDEIRGHLAELGSRKAIARRGGGPNPMKIVVVAGARPNFMKIAPLMWELGRRPGVEACLVHTGQHYDRAMSHALLRGAEASPGPTSTSGSARARTPSRRPR